MDTIELLLQKTMLIEIYKCLNGIGAAYLADLFRYGGSSTRSNGKNLQVPRIDSVLYGNHSIRFHGTKLWVAMPESCKTATSLVNFKTGLKSFSGIQCKCWACKFTNNVSYLISSHLISSHQYYIKDLNYWIMISIIGLRSQ